MLDSHQLPQGLLLGQTPRCFVFKLWYPGILSVSCGVPPIGDSLSYGICRTKIVATIGPATADTDALKTLFEAGVDVARLNCSHSTAEGTLTGRLPSCRSAIQLQTDRHPAGPAGPEDPHLGPGKPIDLAPGDTLTVKMDPTEATGDLVGTTWPSMVEDVKVASVVFADGAWSGAVSDVREDAVDITIDAGGKLGLGKGINMPESDIVAPALTEKDRADLAVGLAAGVDWVALSFVRHRRDVEILREAMAEHGVQQTTVVAKIEKASSRREHRRDPRGCGRHHGRAWRPRRGGAAGAGSGDSGRSSSRPPIAQASPSSPRPRCWTAGAKPQLRIYSAQRPPTCATPFWMYGCRHVVR